MTGGYRVRMLGIVVWTTAPELVEKRLLPAETSSTGCAQEKVGHFLGKLSTGISPQGSAGILWKTVAAEGCSCGKGVASENSSGGVADIWLMVTALDPELGRRILRYTAPTDQADDLNAW